MRKINKIASDEKLEVLAEFLEISPNEISYNGEEYETPNGVYVVMDEEEAVNTIYEFVEEEVDYNYMNFLEEYGIDDVIFDFLDYDFFTDWYYNDCAELADELIDDGTFIETCIDEDIISEDDEEFYEDDIDSLREKFIDKKFNSLSYEDTIELFIDIFGNEALVKAIREGDVTVDVDKLVDWLQDNFEDSEFIVHQDCQTYYFNNYRIIELFS